MKMCKIEQFFDKFQQILFVFISSKVKKNESFFDLCIVECKKVLSLHHQRNTKFLKNLKKTK